MFQCSSVRGLLEMASDRRSMTLGSMDIANRKLPDLPDEAYGGSKLSRFWSTLKSKISSSSRHSSLRRSQSVTADPHTGRPSLGNL